MSKLGVTAGLAVALAFAAALKYGPEENIPTGKAPEKTAAPPRSTAEYYGQAAKPTGKGYDLVNPADAICVVGKDGKATVLDMTDAGAFAYGEPLNVKKADGVCLYTTENKRTLGFKIR